MAGVEELRVEVIGHVEAFINDSIPLLDAHINGGGHTIGHLQDIINTLNVMFNDTADPDNLPQAPLVVAAAQQSSAEDSGGAPGGSGSTA